MPISDDEWEAGRTLETFEGQILTFLKQNKKPFNISEIVNGLGYNIQTKDFWSFLGSIAGYWTIQNALNNLVKEGKVESRTIKQSIGEQVYYRDK